MTALAASAPASVGSAAVAPPPLVSFDTQHEDMIHDSQLDYYGRKLATASSDRTIKVWDVAGDSYALAATLSGHDGPVWQVAWAHPMFGVLLASCSYDGKVLIHRESPGGVWTPIHEQRTHAASVNSVAWAPHEYGLLLGCASSDGSVSLLKHQPDDSWACEVVPEPSRLGVNALSWAPFKGATTQALPPLQFATASCDKAVRVYTQGPDGSWTPETLPLQHEDWVRDVAFAPATAALSSSSSSSFSSATLASSPSSSPLMLASCGEDRAVFIWTKEAGGGWVCAPLAPKFETSVWRVSWSVTGNLLAVSAADHQVTLWKQNLNGQWENVSTVVDTAE